MQKMTKPMLVVALASLIGACAPINSTPSIPSAPQVITFAANSLHFPTLRPLAERFMAENPDIIVDVIHTTTLANARQLQDVATVADCFSWMAPPNPDDLQQLQNLRPLLDADTLLQTADFPAPLFALFETAEGLFGLPHIVTFRVLAYNQRLFDQAGLSSPEKSWDLDTFLGAAETISQALGEGRAYGFTSPDSQARDLVFFLGRFGVSPIQELPDGIVLDFTEEELIRALRWYITFASSTTPNQGFSGHTLVQSLDSRSVALIQGGRVGMWLDFYTAFSGQVFGEEPSGFTVGIAPPPQLDNNLQPSDFAVSGLYISALTPHTDLCWRWLRFISDDGASAAGGFPARLSVARSEPFLSRAPEGSISVFEAYLPALQNNALSPSALNLFSQRVDYFWFFRAIDRAMQGADLEAELSDAEVLTRQFVACVEMSGRPGECAREVDPTYNGWNQ